MEDDVHLATRHHKAAEDAYQDDDKAYAVQHDTGCSLANKTLLIGNYRMEGRWPVMI